MRFLPLPWCIYHLLLVALLIARMVDGKARVKRYDEDTMDDENDDGDDNVDNLATSDGEVVCYNCNSTGSICAEGQCPAVKSCYRISWRRGSTKETNYLLGCLKEDEDAEKFCSSGAVHSCFTCEENLCNTACKPFVFSAAFVVLVLLSTVVLRHANLVLFLLVALHRVLLC